MPVTSMRFQAPGSQDGIYIGRSSEQWGNPYVLHRRYAGQLIHTCNRSTNTILVATREEAISRFRAFLWESIERDPTLIPMLSALEGQTLICHCAPLACHGDVLESAASWATAHLAAEVAS